MKKAFLVTFEVTTRVVADVDGRPGYDNVKAWNTVVDKALEKAFIDGDNVERIEEDTEHPYNPETDDE